MSNGNVVYDLIKFLKPEDGKKIVSESVVIEEAIKRYTLAQLKAMPTIEQGHTDNLKYDDGTYRVWLSRMTKADGMPYDNQVTVEQMIGGVWKTVAEYQPASGGYRPEMDESKINEAVDEGYKREIYNWIWNTETLYTNLVRDFYANLLRKMIKGTYDKTLAVKLMRYMADRAVQDYARANQTNTRDVNGETRNALAAELVEKFESDVKTGEDHGQNQQLFAKLKSKNESIREEIREGSKITISPTPSMFKELAGKPGIVFEAPADGNYIGVKVDGQVLRYFPKTDIIEDSMPVEPSQGEKEGFLVSDEEVKKDAELDKRAGVSQGVVESTSIKEHDAPERGPQWLKHHGKVVKVDGKKYKISASSHDAIYPYKHKSYTASAEMVDKNDPEYLTTKKDLGDDWSTDLLDSDPEVAAKFLKALGESKEEKPKEEIPSKGDQPTGKDQPATAKSDYIEPEGKSLDDKAKSISVNKITKDNSTDISKLEIADNKPEEIEKKENPPVDKKEEKKETEKK